MGSHTSMRSMDVTSCLQSSVIAKRSGWQILILFEEAFETFTNLSQHPALIRYLDLQMLHRFVVVIYDRSSANTSVDEASKQRSYNPIPPTQTVYRVSVQPIRLWLSGARRLSPTRIRAIPLNGWARRKEGHGKLSLMQELSGTDKIFRSERIQRKMQVLRVSGDLHITLLCIGRVWTHTSRCKAYEMKKKKQSGGHL